MFMSKTKRMTVQAHRIIWMLANGEPIPDEMQINHKDGDGNNNLPSNLEIATPSENVMHAIRVLGRNTKARGGEENASAKLTEEQVVSIRIMASQRLFPQRRIAEMFGIKQQTVSNIYNNRTWRVSTGP